MEAEYVSSRKISNTSTSSQAILNGLSKDGGLFIKKNLHQIKIELSTLKNKSYEQIAEIILNKFLSDYSDIEIKNAIKLAYTDRFSKEEITPLIKLNKNYYILELFHGPTSAFKDIALSLLPHLMEIASKKNNLEKKILILTATSGDTGKAALEAFKDVDGIKIIVFYPNEGVSEVQKRQMISQEGDNVFVVGINGNFDDAQSAVKQVFNDPELKVYFQNKDIKLSSANSINIGRLFPQVVYYFSAYMELVQNSEIKLGEEINFSIPTGNFGNILAGYYAKMIGLPINKLICASNENNVIYEFFKTGVYNKNREFLKTLSPSMDILISSNLERLLYDLCDENCNYIDRLMRDLDLKGTYEINKNIKDRINKIFFETFATDLQTKEKIKEIYKKYDYLLDPHTAVAYLGAETFDDNTKKTVILSTASPYKFSKTVYESIFEKTENLDEFQLMNLLQNKTNIEAPKNLIDLKSKAIYHTDIIDKEYIKKYIEEMKLW